MSSPLHHFATLIGDAMWSNDLQQHLFGTTDPHDIAALIDDFCAEWLGARIERVRHHHKGVGVVSGLDLDDGRAVVVKVHRRELVEHKIDAVVRVQRALHADGFPAPRPLLAPVPLAAGLATVEDLLDVGAMPDPRSTATPGDLARGLRRLLAATRKIDPAGLGPAWPGLPDDEPWPVPHDVRFDLAATARGAEWIDDLAASARARLRDQAGALMIGHFDWRVENLRVADGEVVAVYDWDSVTLGHEPALVGHASKSFSIDWSSGEADPITTLEESKAFLREYEALRPAPFSEAEWETIDAAHLYGLAYCARCQHCDVVEGLTPENEGIGFIARLRERSERWLVR